jgi:hypothetical protein
MSMRNREGALTPREEIELQSRNIGQREIKRGTWNPSEGAERQRKLIEDQIRQQHLAETEKELQSPHNQRLTRLEERFEQMCTDFRVVLNKMEELNAKS